MSLSLRVRLCVRACTHLPVHRCEAKGLVELQPGTNRTDVVCGESQRWRSGSGLGSGELTGTQGHAETAGAERGR